MFSKLLLDNPQGDTIVSLAISSLPLSKIVSTHLAKGKLCVNSLAEWLWALSFMFVWSFWNIFRVSKSFSFGVLGKHGVLIKKYFYLVPLSQSHSFSYFSIPDIHIFTCVCLYLYICTQIYIWRITLITYKCAYLSIWKWCLVNI